MNDNLVGCPESPIQCISGTNLWRCGLASNVMLFLLILLCANIFTFQMSLESQSDPQDF